MERVTMEWLQDMCDILNRPLGIKGPVSHGVPNAYRIDVANGGYALEQLDKDGCGSMQLLGRTNMRDLYRLMNAFIKGMEAAK